MTSTLKQFKRRALARPGVKKAYSELAEEFRVSVLVVDIGVRREGEEDHEDQYDRRQQDWPDRSLGLGCLFGAFAHG